MKLNKYGIAIVYKEPDLIDNAIRQAIRRFNNLPRHSNFVTNSTCLNTT